MNRLTIRPTTSQDFDALAAIFVQSYNQLDIGEEWDAGSSIQLFQWYMNQNPELAFVAERDGAIIGGIFSLLKPWHDGMHLSELEIFVDPHAQQTGAGSQLLKTMLEYGVEHHSAVLCEGVTHTKKEHPLKWYESIGFKQDEIWVVIAGNTQEILQKLS